MRNGKPPIYRLMKTKIFLAFVIVILTALLSNFIFEWLIMRDFDNYVKGVKADQFYWILASVESSYTDGQWDKSLLSESIHWAMMMGLNIKIIDVTGKEVISSHHVMGSISGAMKHRMESIFHIHTDGGKFDEYPLSFKGKPAGTLLWKPFQKEAIKEKELIFKRRTKNFLLISFLIAGVGSLLIAWSLSRYISKPVTELKKAAEKIGNRDFNVRTTPQSGDEVGKLSQTFNLMAESLQKEEQLRKHLMSNIAHELKTPLTIMKSQAEAMADGIITDREKGLENIKTEIEHLIKLVRGIEDVTTAEASFFKKAVEEEVNLGEFLSGLADEMAPAFREKSLDITVAKTKDLTIVTDVEKLELIMRNLLSNALKFTENGSVFLTYGTEGGTFFIEVRDTGKGIPESDLPRIFDRFYRVEKTTVTGLGLGLAIAKELVDVMGGRVEVESKTGKGSAFRVYLPIKDIAH